MHQLVVRYSRVSTQPPSPRRSHSKRIEGDPNLAPRRIEEIDLTITRESGTGRLGFGIDQMNTVVEVDPKGPVASKLQVGDTIHIHTHTHIHIHTSRASCRSATRFTFT